MESHPATLALTPGGSARAGCPSDDDILAYLPGELSGEKADSIAAHLASCTLCQLRASTLRQRLSDQPAPAFAARAKPALPQADSDSPQTIENQLPARTAQRLNEYELLEPIGRGGMGVVYRARHVRLQRIVAVKVLPRMAVTDESAVVRMQRETAAAGRVEHPNIVYATDAGECDGVHYLVMEFVPGVDLSKLVAAAGPLLVADACEIVRQAALGLGHIAECGLVHRDLKPSNLMLADDGAVKILDLGLALLHRNPLDDYEATQPGYLLGTADYIAPEQIDAPHEVDVRSDLYSLGCTLFKMLTGVAPFSGPEQNSVSRKVDAHRHRPPPPVSSLRPDVPPEVEALIAKLLAKRPGDRFQRPAELARAIAPLARGANLAALANRMRESAELDLPLGAPVDSRATTRSLAKSVTPRPLAAAIRGLPAWAKFTAAAVLLATALGIAALVRSDPGGPPDPGRPVVYDLNKPAQVMYIGWQPTAIDPQFDADKKMLAVKPDSHLLLQIGVHDGRPGTFAFTLQQSPTWQGFAGMYFGYRPEPREGREVTTMQLFQLEHFWAMGTGPRSVPELFRFRRERAWLPVSEHPYTRHDIGTARSVDFPSPGVGPIRFEIEFGPAVCRRVTANGVLLPELSAPALNAEYRPEDYLGPFGLYCLPGENPPSTMWFGNLVFTPAEK